MEASVAVLKADLDDVRKNNDFREEENHQLQEDLSQLESNLEALEGQNGALERELEHFVTQEDNIKEKLRSPSKPKEAKPHL